MEKDLLQYKDEVDDNVATVALEAIQHQICYLTPFCLVSKQVPDPVAITYQGEYNLGRKTGLLKLPGTVTASNKFTLANLVHGQYLLDSAVQTAPG